MGEVYGGQRRSPRAADAEEQELRALGLSPEGVQDLGSCGDKTIRAVEVADDSEGP